MAIRKSLFIGSLICVSCSSLALDKTCANHSLDKIKAFLLKQNISVHYYSPWNILISKWVELAAKNKSKNQYSKIAIKTKHFMYILDFMETALKENVPREYEKLTDQYQKTLLDRIGEKKGKKDIAYLDVIELVEAFVFVFSIPYWRGNMPPDIPQKITMYIKDRLEQGYVFGLSIPTIQLPGLKEANILKMTPMMLLPVFIEPVTYMHISESDGVVSRKQKVASPYDLFIEYFISQNPHRLADEEIFRSITKSRGIATDEVFQYLSGPRLMFEKYRLQQFNNLDEAQRTYADAMYAHIWRTEGQSTFDLPALNRWMQDQQSVEQMAKDLRLNAGAKKDTQKPTATELVQAFEVLRNILHTFESSSEIELF